MPCVINWALRHVEVWGSRDIVPPFVTSALDEISGQFHPEVALPPVKDFPVPIVNEDG